MKDPEKQDPGVGRVETDIVSITLPDEGLCLEHGGTLHELQVACERYGELNEARDNVVFICHALTGDAHVAGLNNAYESEVGWWDKMIGPGRGIDTRYYHVVCANILGGCKGTTGPSSVNPATGKPYGADFPRMTVADIVDVHRLLLRELGVDRVAVVIGGSFGGMQALEWAIRYPDELDQCVVIASAARLGTQALAFDIIGRRAITDDPGWQEGDYYESDASPEQGLAQARKLAHVTYLSQELMGEKFGRRRRKEWVEADAESAERAARNFWTSFEVESYLQYQGKKFTRRFDANSYLHITRAMDEYDLVERFDSLDNAFAGVQAKMLVVALSGDWLFLPEQSIEIAVALQRQRKRVSYCKLEAPNGHDAFLTHVEHLAELLRAFMPWIGRERPKHVIPQKELGCACRNRHLTIMELVEPEMRNVLDLGCGDGELLSLLSGKGIHAVGIEINLEQVVRVLEQGDNVLLEDILLGLSAIPDQSYDCAVMSETLQAVLNPQQVLHEVLRVARKGIIAFPNFGYWPVRSQLLFNGRMPKGRNLPFEWYDTPNIHLFTVKDFKKLCADEDLKIEAMTARACEPLGKVLTGFGALNLGAERVVARVSRL